MSRTPNRTPPLRYHKQTRRYYIFYGGKRVYLGSQRSKAEKRRLDMIASIISGAPAPVVHSIPSGGMTLASAVVQFREWAVTFYTDSRTLFRFDVMITAALSVHAETPVALFDGEAVEDIREHLLGRKPQLARGYINCLIRALKTMFAWFKKRKIVSAGVLAEVRQVRALMPGDGGRETTPVPPVEVWVVNATRPECSPTIRAMIDLQRATGMRPGELCQMRRCEITTSPDEAIPVPGQSRHVKAVDVNGTAIWLYVPSRHKNLHRGKMRVVAIGPEGQKVLTPFLNRAPNDYIFRPADDLTPAQQKALDVGTCYTVRAFHNALVRAVQRANKLRRQAADKGLIPTYVEVPSWSPNQLRHAAAEAAAEKTDAESAAILLGHSASRRALDAYVAACIQRASEPAAKVG